VIAVDMVRVLDEVAGHPRPGAVSDAARYGPAVGELFSNWLLWAWQSRDAVERAEIAVARWSELGVEVAKATPMPDFDVADAAVAAENRAWSALSAAIEAAVESAVRAAVPPVGSGS
jgi:hypothetical protein